MSVCVFLALQLQEEKEDVQRKLVILQDDLEKSEARADEYRKEAEEKASALDETERSVIYTISLIAIHQSLNGSKLQKVL